MSYWKRIMSKAVPSSAVSSPILKDKNLSKILFFDQNFHCSNMSGTWHRNEVLGFHQLWNSLGLNKLSRPQCKQYISRGQRWGNYWSPQAKSNCSVWLSLRAKRGFSIFKKLKMNQKKNNFFWHENYMKFYFQCPLGRSQTHYSCIIYGC